MKTFYFNLSVDLLNHDIIFSGLFGLHTPKNYVHEYFKHSDTIPGGI